jgi:hypothetical protein
MADPSELHATRLVLEGCAWRHESVDGDIAWDVRSSTARHRHGRSTRLPGEDPRHANGDRNTDHRQVPRPRLNGGGTHHGAGIASAGRPTATHVGSVSAPSEGERSQDTTAHQTTVVSTVLDGGSGLIVSLPPRQMDHSTEVRLPSAGTGSGPSVGAFI